MRNLKETHNRECQNLFTYLKSRTHPTYTAICSLHSAMASLRLASQEPPVKENKNYCKEIEQNWKSKELHGRYAATLNGQDVDKELSTLYHTRGVLMMETEGFLLAIQDQVIFTKNYRRYILR